MARTALTSVPKNHADHRTARSRMRESSRLVDSEIASTGAMEGSSSEDRGAKNPSTSKSDRPQQDATLAEYCHTPGPTTVRIYDDLVPFKTKLKQALATSKLFVQAKKILRPTAPDLECSPSYPGDTSARGASLGMQQTDNSRRAPGQGSNPSVSSSHGTGLWEISYHCVRLFERLVEEARKLAKPSHPAGEYFLSLYYISECQLRRLKTWDRNTELTHPNFGDSYPNDLKDRITNLLKEITSAIERIGWEMDLLRALVSRESSEQNEKDNEREGSQPGQRVCRRVRNGSGGLGTLGCLSVLG